MKKIFIVFKLKYIVVLVLYIFLVAAPVSAASVPYGGSNIYADRESAFSLYPEVLKKHFDDKFRSIVPTTPTLDRMSSSSSVAASLASDEPGEVGRMTTNEELAAFVRDLPRTYLRTLSLGRFPVYGEDGAVEETFELPLLIFSKPAAFDAHTLQGRGKPIVYLQGQIHGDESSGGEALLAIAKDLSGNRNGWLDKMSVIVLPRFNLDGARRNQRGTHTAHPDYENLDMNRDAVATASPLTRAVRNMLAVYRPDVGVDFHEMGYAADGSSEYLANGAHLGYRYYHHEDLATLVAHPWNVPARVTELAYELEAGVGAALASAGLATATYVTPAEMVPEYRQMRKDVEVMRDGSLRSGYVTYPGSWIEGVPDEAVTDSAASLAPSVTLLFESRSPKVLTNFRTRVYAHYVAASSILSQVAARPDVFRKAVAQGAERIAAMGKQAASADEIVLWARQWEDRSSDRSVLALNARKDAFSEEALSADAIYRNGALTPVHGVRRPYAYILDLDGSQADALAARLALTGVTLHRLTKEAKLPVEAYTVTSVATTGSSQVGYAVRGSDYFSANQRRTLSHAINGVDTGETAKIFPAGTYLFFTAQPAANLAALAVEPLANRNLANYWYTRSQEKKDTTGYIPFAVNREFPVYRYTASADLTAETDEVILQMPFVAGAFVTWARPLISGDLPEGAVFGYDFTALDPASGAAPSSFSLTPPAYWGSARIPYWTLYNWADEVHELVSLSTGNVPVIQVRSSHIDRDGRVLVYAYDAEPTSSSVVPEPPVDPTDPQDPRDPDVPGATTSGGGGGCAAGAGKGALWAPLLLVVLRSLFRAA